MSLYQSREMLTSRQQQQQISEKTGILAFDGVSYFRLTIAIPYKILVFR
jgi:hypothetical protein